MRTAKVSLALFVVLTLMACASIVDLQAKWNKLSEPEKTRIILGGFQDQLDNLFQAGKAHVVVNPSQQVVWKQKVIPAFDTANKTLRGLTILASSIDAGNVTPQKVYETIPPLIQSVVKLMLAMGVKL